MNVNARNSYGGYTGWQGYRFMIRDGRIVQILFPGGDNRLHNNTPE